MNRGKVCGQFQEVKFFLGEPIMDALKREILEETGLRIETLNHLCTFDDIVSDADENPAFHFVFIDYIAYPIRGQLRASSDVIQAKWMTMDEIYDLYKKGQVPNASIISLKHLSPTQSRARATSLNCTTWQ